MNYINPFLEILIVFVVIILTFILISDNRENSEIIAILSVFGLTSIKALPYMSNLLSAINTLKNDMIKKVELITPNIPEAEILSELKINSIEDMIFAGKKLIHSEQSNLNLFYHFSFPFKVNFR